MKIFHHILCLLLVAMASACSQDDLDVSALSPDQRKIGLVNLQNTE